VPTASSMHQVNVWTIRTKDTVDEEVLRSQEEKKAINDVLLDRYRRLKAEKELEF
jgi:SNF2 family DNA or RNA helicase